MSLSNSLGISEDIFGEVAGASRESKAQTQSATNTDNIPEAPTGKTDRPTFTTRTDFGDDNEEGQAKLGLDTWRLAALTFFTVSGGPYGLEPLVQYGGPISSIFGLLFIPWVWGLPMAMMTAELASAIPEMGGYVVWVQRTMGDSVAFQNAMWNLFTNVMDNTLYPLLFLDYIEDLVGHDFSFMTRFLVGSCLTIFLGFVNVVGVDVVGDGAGVFGVLVLIPFILLIFTGLFGGEMNVARWSDTIEEKSMSGFMSILLWNTCGYDSAGTCAAEVENPGKTYMNAMLITVTLTSLVYVLPIMIGVCYATQYSKWDDGYFVTVGENTAGEWLGYFISIGGAVSALGLLNSTMCTTSRALASMSSFGYVPTYFAKLHPKYGTPYRSIGVNTGAIILLLATGLDFEAVAELSMWLYGLTLIFEFGALIILRIKEPNLERPFRIPLSRRGIYLMSAPPCLCCLVLFFVSEVRTWLICGTILIISALALIPYYRIQGRPVKLAIPRKLRRQLAKWGINLNIATRLSTEDHFDNIGDTRSNNKSGGDVQDYHNRGGTGMGMEMQQRKPKGDQQKDDENMREIYLH